MTRPICPECNSRITSLKRRCYHMFTEDGKRLTTKTYKCEMCACEMLPDGTSINTDRKQTVSSGGSQGYHKMM
jgi:hypothetical protein